MTWTYCTLVLALGFCSSPTLALSQINLTTTTDGKPSTQTKAHFTPRPAPVQKAMVGFVSTQPFTFTDSKGKVWTAPAGTKTDGASIPAFCMPYTGEPTRDEYFDAAVIHDAYCARANKGGDSFRRATWQQVHRMFYEACLVGGTKERKAKAMYAAVWMFGPKNWRYEELPAGPGQPVNAPKQYRIVELPESRNPLDIRSVNTRLKAKQFALIAEFIRSRNPSITTLDQVLRQSASKLKQGQVLSIPKNLSSAPKNSRVLTLVSGGGF